MDRITRHRCIAFAAAAAAWLATGNAAADAVSALASAAGGTPGALAYATDNAALAAQCSIMVIGLLAITGACFAWLLYLMLTAPPECGEQPQPPKPATAAPESPVDSGDAHGSLLWLLPPAPPPQPLLLGGTATSLLLRLLRRWIGAHLGTGPM
ncbi:MAG TPA: hypothetical protein VFA75_09290 [Nevskia sp.]|nr:hypothetical protein [Nevskia sp.]